MNLTRGIQISLFNLLIVGSIGCFLRYVQLYPVSGVNYNYVLHAHSHLALLGWVFMALYVLIVYAYMPSEMENKGKFTALFVLLQVTNIGMLVTFPVMGYALWSIIFSALHGLMSLVFAWLFISKAPLLLAASHTSSFAWIKWALILMIVSNLAPFALGPVAATQGKGDLYYLLIYFYLHFQYNGWFTFALLGLILWLMEENGVNTNTQLVRVGLKLKLMAVAPAYILSSLWINPDAVWFVIGGLAAFMQLAGLSCLFVFVVQKRGLIFSQGPFMLKMLFMTGFLAIGLQHTLMLLSAIPELVSLAFARNTVIAYLHLVLIGFVSVWLFMLFLKLEFVETNLVTNFGFLSFVIAFIATELILVTPGSLNSSTNWLFYLALIQLCGIICIALNVKRLNLNYEECIDN